MSGLRSKRRRSWKEGDHGDIKKRWFFRKPGVKCTSSSPWVSVNYFSPLTVEESTEPKTVSDYPLENERNEKCIEVEVRRKEVEGRQMKRLEKPKEGTAEWVLLFEK